MSDTASASMAQLSLNSRRLRAGVLLTVIGGMAGAAGSIIAALELATATRRWLADSGYPPSEVAKVRLRQAVHASQAAQAAARQAWLTEQAAQARGPVVADITEAAHAE